MVATTQGAHYDNRPKMPRVSCAHYDQRVGAFTEEECTMMEDMEATPTDFFCQTTWQNLSQTNKPAQPGQPDLTQPGPTGHPSQLKVLRQSCIPVYSLHDGPAGQHKQCLNKAECVSTSQVQPLAPPPQYHYHHLHNHHHLQHHHHHRIRSVPGRFPVG